jgi:hypothetical protein
VTVAMIQTQMDGGSEFGEVDYSLITSFARLGLEAEAHIDSTDLSDEMIAAMEMLNS